MVRDLHEANPSIPVLVLTVIEDPEIHEEVPAGGGERGAAQEHLLPGDARRGQEVGHPRVECGRPALAYIPGLG